MQTQTIDSAAERTTLLACITKSAFLTRTNGRVGKEPFRSQWSNLIYGWCKKYHAKYGKAPGRIIESLFESWAAKTQDKDSKTTISRFLSSLSGEYAQQAKAIDLEYVTDLAEGHFNEVLLERAEEELRQRRERNSSAGSWEFLGALKKIELRGTPVIDVLGDEAAQREALEYSQRAIVKYSDAAGAFFGNCFSEDSFIGVMANSKGTKSWFLLDVAWRGMLQGKRVAYFQVGDLSKNQIMRRFHKRASYRPLEAKLIKFPIGMVLPQGAKDIATVEFEDRTYEKALSWDVAKRAFQNRMKKSKGRIRLSYHPTKSVSVADIQAILNSWDRAGWRAELVVIDYAGNLAPIDSKMMPVDQVTLSWAMMRQISEMRKCCVITAQQTNKEGFKAWVLTRTNFAESKYILAHVTDFIGINRTDEEVNRGIIRYNFIVQREGFFSETYCLYAAHCLDVANPIVLSVLPT